MPRATLGLTEGFCQLVLPATVTWHALKESLLILRTTLVGPLIDAPCHAKRIKPHEKPDILAFRKVREETPSARTSDTPRAGQLTLHCAPDFSFCKKQLESKPSLKSIVSMRQSMPLSFTPFMHS